MFQQESIQQNSTDLRRKILSIVAEFSLAHPDKGLSEVLSTTPLREMIMEKCGGAGPLVDCLKSVGVSWAELVDAFVLVRPSMQRTAKLFPDRVFLPPAPPPPPPAPAAPILPKASVRATGTVVTAGTAPVTAGGEDREGLPALRRVACKTSNPPAPAKTSRSRVSAGPAPVQGSLF